VIFFYFVYYRQDLPEGQLCRYCFCSRADFSVFRPVRATCCTDEGEILHGSLSLPNFTLIGSEVGVTANGPKN